jgi:peroxiredoxin family protein
MSEEEEKITMVVFSGAIDRLIGMGILTQAAIAMDYSVDIYLMFWGTYAFKKDIIGKDKTLSEHFDFSGEKFEDILKTGGISHWYEMIKQAKEMGRVKVYVCAACGKAWDANLENLDFVDDIVGAGEIVWNSTESKATYFI